MNTGTQHAVRNKERVAGNTPMPSSPKIETYFLFPSVSPDHHGHIATEIGSRCSGEKTRVLVLGWQGARTEASLGLLDAFAVAGSPPGTLMGKQRWKGGQLSNAFVYRRGH